MTATVPEGLLYTKEHEWLKVSGNTAVAGITHYAQESLGDLVFVELPAVGALLKQHKEFAVVESVKAASEVYAPVSGEVLAVNEELSSSPEFINQSPYEQGWIAKVRIDDESELEDMMDAEEYQQYLKEIA
jgi:glycine cleavage system H protein